MANQIKLSRYEEIIKQVINNCLVQEINNPIAKYGVVTSVKLTHDLEVARIYLDCLKRQDIVNNLVNVLAF